MRAAMLFPVQCVLLFIAVLKGRDVFSPWAEDATLLILGSLQSPFAIYHPVLDSIFVLSRLVTSVAVGISLQYAPVILAFFSITVVVGVGCYFLQDSFRWLVPSRIARICVSFLLCIGPGALEIGGNAIGLTYAVGVFLVLLALEEIPVRRSLFYPLWTLLVFSTNLSAIAVPVLLVRYYVTRNVLYIKALVILIAAVLINVLVAKGVSSEQTQLVLPTVSQLASTIGSSSMLHCLLVPIFGALHFIFLPIFTPISVLFTLVSALLFVSMFRELNRTNQLTVLALCASTVLYFILHQIARPYDFLDDSYLPTTGRIYFITLTLPFIAWLTLISHYTKLSARFRTQLVCMITFLHLVPYVNRMVTSTAHAPTEKWANFVQDLTLLASGSNEGPANSETVSVVIDPDEWAKIHCRKGQSSTLACTVEGGNGQDHPYKVNL